MTTNKKFYVGQPVMIRDSSYRAPKVLQYTVTKVGRTLVYVEIYGRPWGFRMADGTESRGQNAIGMPAQLFTLEEWDEWVERREISEKIQNHDFRPGSSGRFKQSTETLRKVLEILDAEVK